MITKMDVQDDDDDDDDCSSSDLLLPRFDRLELVGNSQLTSVANNIWYMLDRKLGDQIAAYFYIHAIMCPTAMGSLFHSCSELPEWCKSNVNCKMEWPPPSTNKYQGIAFGIVFSSDAKYQGIAFGIVFSSDAIVGELKMKCDVVIEGTTVTTFSSPVVWIDGGSGASSDYVFLWFHKSFFGKTNEAIEKEEEEQYKDAIQPPHYVKLD
ncbi:hypothetical protein LINGRAPRIM_LOCUS3382 [Linum grandiflorum]